MVSSALCVVCYQDDDVGMAASKGEVPLVSSWFYYYEETVGSEG